MESSYHRAGMALDIGNGYAPTGQIDSAPAPRKRSRGCRRLDGLCKLTDAQKTERDATMRRWLNLRKIERVAHASGKCSPCLGARVWGR